MAEENIFLFYPNLIGYGRVITAFIALWFLPTNPWIAMCSYIFSALLDAVDGHVARMFNQSTRFGAMLDMLTDRCALLGLVVGLTIFYPQYAFFFQLSAIIDVASHWLFMVTTYFCGKNSHKSVSVTDNAIIGLYYTSKPFLFIMCAGNELFYCAMYLYSFYPDFLIGNIIQLYHC